MSVTCIIPAYNEGSRIANVLSVVQNHPLVTQLIVVNDGSVDNTLAVARSFKRAQVIDLQPNRGKSFAVMSGIKAAKNDLIMMLDADLVGLTHKDLDRLIRPVLNGRVDITLSLRKNSLLPYRWMGIDFVSGERVFHKTAIGPMTELGKLRGYGLEVYFNERIIAQHLRLRIIPFDHAISVRKGDKVGFFTGLRLETGMVLQILKTAGLWRVLRQMRVMRSLRH